MARFATPVGLGRDSGELQYIRCRLNRILAQEQEQQDDTDDGAGEGLFGFELPSQTRLAKSITS
jgi:hypothetical protein